MVTPTFPGQHVPISDSPSDEGIFPKIQSKPLLVQREAISSFHLGEKPNSHLATTSFQRVLGSK